MSLNILGSLALDSVETPFGREEEALGGSASYAAIASSFFCDAKIHSAIGEDFPKEYVELLQENGVDLSEVEVLQGKTFRWKARYKAQMDHAYTLRTELGVFSDYDLSEERPPIKGDILLANIDPELQEKFLSFYDFSGIVACDTMGHWISTKKNAILKLLRKVDIFLLNDAEAREISGERSLLDAARYLNSKGAGMVVIKKGENGILFFKKGLHFMLPGYLVGGVQDPTGAGDSFAGGMMGYLSSSERELNDIILRRALVYGSIIASFAVGEFSVKGLLKINMKDITERYGKFVELTAF